MVQDNVMKLHRWSFTMESELHTTRLEQPGIAYERRIFDDTMLLLT